MPVHEREPEARYGFVHSLGIGYVFLPFALMKAVKHVVRHNVFNRELLFLFDKLNRNRKRASSDHVLSVSGPGSDGEGEYSPHNCCLQCIKYVPWR